jgi:hypothetical protein
MLCLDQPVATQDVTLDRIFANASAYASRFMSQFAQAVAEEQFVQVIEQATIPFGARTLVWEEKQRRRLRSDVLLVRTGGPMNWTMFRDVFEVDGKPVRDRDDRLGKIFAGPAPDVVRAAAIAHEGARFNIGPLERTTNSPLLSLLFLGSDVRPRFTFSLDRRDGSGGSRTWIVEYTEVARPTVVRGENDRDVPASGRFWIDVDTGQVSRADLTLEMPEGQSHLVTMFKPDARFGVAVPVEMRERFEFGRTRFVGTATYGRFRSFTVTTNEAIGGQAR